MVNVKITLSSRRYFSRIIKMLIDYGMENCRFIFKPNNGKNNIVFRIMESNSQNVTCNLTIRAINCLDFFCNEPISFNVLLANLYNCLQSSKLENKLTIAYDSDSDPRIIWINDVATHCIAEKYDGIKIQPITFTSRAMFNNRVLPNVYRCFCSTGFEQVRVISQENKSIFQSLEPDTELSFSDPSCIQLPESKLPIETIYSLDQLKCFKYRFAKLPRLYHNENYLVLEMQIKNMGRLYIIIQKNN